MLRFRLAQALRQLSPARCNTAFLLFVCSLCMASLLPTPLPAQQEDHDGNLISNAEYPPAPPAPAAEQVEVRRVFHNGEHNAFTDLCKFQGRYYLTFRSCPDGHGVHPTSSIIVLVSDDLRDWSEAFRFRIEKRDTRDPHFLEFRDKLFVYTGTWYCGESTPASYDMNQHLGFAVWTADGQTWQGPRMLEGTYGHYIWRAAARGSRAYLCGRRKHHFTHTSSRAERDPLVETALLESEDGLVWKTNSLMKSEYGNETALLFRPTGNLLAVARGGGRRDASLLESQPPYERWRESSLERYIGGPLLAQWNGRYLVAGRDLQDGRAITKIWWLEQGELIPLASLPSGGDNSYPGFVALDDKHGVFSYYSSHERDAQGRTITAIYLSDITLR